MDKAIAWTTQKGYSLAEHFREIREMAELFGVTQQDISYHLQQINDSGELHLSNGYKKYLYGSEKWSDEAMYNLDVVIAVGYRVNSYEATQFRIWATSLAGICFFGHFPVQGGSATVHKSKCRPDCA